ncbi:MAG: LPXTG cell wall anchor domain-containing protein [Acidimicrobiia bacterium]
MHTRAALTALLTATVGIAATVTLAGPVLAGQGGPYEDAFHIQSVEPSPAVAGTVVRIHVEERNSTGYFIPFTLSGPCISTYTYDPNAYKLPFAYKGQFHADLKLKSDYSGKCTITVSGNGLSASHTFSVTASKKIEKDEDEWSEDKDETSPVKKDEPKVIKKDQTPVKKDDPKGAPAVSGDTFDSTLQSVRSEALPTQQASVAIESASVVVNATPASVTQSATQVAGVSVTNAAVTLPRTGSSSMTQAWFGAALALIGGGFVFFARRKARHADIRSRYLS